MECAQCRHDNPEGSRFCSSCGQSLAAICRQCGHENAPGSRFCNRCGRHIGHRQAPEGSSSAPDVGGQQGSLEETGERRQATVLFTDLTGYTGMNEMLDPEEVELIVSRIKSESARIVQFHGGTVNRFIGDEVMALFGVPHAHEDDPVRATKAAIEIHSAVRQLEMEIDLDIGQRLTMHSGINSGLIVTHEHANLEGPFMVTGNTVNTGARLRSLAGPDEILVGPETQHMISPYIDTEALDPVTLKGMTQPIVPHRVIGVSEIHSRFEAAERKGFTKYTGREHELTTLNGCVERCMCGEGQLITVEGEAGVGKSRLLYEFRHGLDRDQVVVTEGRCQSYGSDTPYLPFVDGLRRGLRLSAGIGSEHLVERVVAGVREIDSGLEQYIPIYLQLLSIRSDYAIPANLQGKELRHATHEALAAIIMRNALAQPVVLFLEDWHWSDEASAAALKHIVSMMADRRVLVVVTHRPDYPLDWGDIGYHTRVFLQPLTERQTESVVRSIMQASLLPVGLAALIHERTAGNPLFVEETCNALLESGTVVSRDGRAELTKALERLALPDSVRAIIRTRLDRLNSDTGEAVRIAAAIGRAFPQRILEQLYGAGASLSELLESLKAQELIKQTRVAPDPEYSFKHILTHEVVYETLLLKQRRKLHTAIGKAMEEVYSDRLEEHAAVLAFHYLRSERQDKAVEFALLAGRKAAQLYANAEATTYFKEALVAVRRLPESTDRSRSEIDAVLELAAVESAQKDISEDRVNLETALELVEQLGDEYRKARILYWLGRVHYILADLNPVIAYARRSLEIADGLSDEALAAPAVNLMGRTYWLLSDFERAASMTERSIEQLRRVGNKAEEATAAGFAGALFGYLGDFERALSYATHSIQLAQEIENPFAEAANYHYRGIIRDQLGQWELAISDYLEARTIAAKAGDMFRVYIVKFMEGRAHTVMGERVLARKLLEESIELADKIGTRFLLGQAKTFLAEYQIVSDEPERATLLCREAMDVAEEAGDKFSSALGRRTLAEALCAAGNSDEEEAVERLEQAIQMQREMGVEPELARSFASYARLLYNRGEGRKAAEYLSTAKERFMALGMNWDLERVSKEFPAG